MTTTNPDIIKTRLVEWMGQMAEMCAFNRSLGQIYGILYISPEPLSLEDIAKDCHMSKGNASIHLRTLETWGAVHQTCKPGTRKDYYTANSDLRALAKKRIHEGLTRRLEFANQRIQSMKEDPALADYLQTPQGSHWKTRFQEIESIVHQVETGFSLLPKLFELKKFLPL